MYRPDAANVIELLKHASRNTRFLNQLCGLGLQNFQALRSAAFFPIAPITMLYGPNSAGKSSVGDAIRFLSGFCNPTSRFDVQGHLERWANWDRLAQGSESASKSGEPTAVQLWAVLSQSDGLPFGGEFLDDWTLGACSLPFSAIYYSTALAVSLKFDTECEPSKTKGRPFELIEYCLWAGVESKAPLVQVLRKVNEHGYAWKQVLIDSEHPEYSNIEWGWGETAEWSLTRRDLRELGEGELGQLLEFSIYDADPFEHDVHPSYELNESEQWEDGLAARIAAARYVRGLIAYSLASVAKACNINHVPPVRQVPSAERSTFSIVPHSSKDGIRGYLLQGEPDSHDAWRRIAQSIADLPSAVPAQDSQEQLPAYLNRVMGDESLLGLGYRISGDVFDVVSRPRIGSKDHQSEGSSIVHLYLTSDAGHDVEFEDVGTGVSQLVPIIVALHQQACIIHQPELHLHPQVQSKMGDVLLARELRPLTIVESHSEHMLLRLLRRVRETTRLGRDRAPFPLDSEELCVLYFDRRDEGYTEVKNLRVNHSGEFLDRWPRGFFSERDEDLFDV